MKSIFRYYDGKFNQLKDILQILQDNITSFYTVVDVFGGSGKILLNIPDEWKKLKVYNNLNEDLYTTFKVLQDQKKRSSLVKKLRMAFAQEKVIKEMKTTHYGRDVDIAFRLLYLQTCSFMGDCTTYGRRYKGNVRISKFSIENFI